MPNVLELTAETHTPDVEVDQYGDSVWLSVKGNTIDLTASEAKQVGKALRAAAKGANE